MRHRSAKKRLGRTTSHREAMTRNFIVSVIEHERVETTLAKAKALRPEVEKLLSLGREKTLHSYRRALSKLQSRAAATKLFDELGPRYANRPGGYTRIVRLPDRRIGDGSTKALFELVDNQVLAKQLAEQADDD